MTFQRTHDLIRLARPFPDKYISIKPGTAEADYVSHSVVEQKLILVLKRIPEITVLREIYDGEGLSGVVLRMTVIVDGNEVSVEEAGASSNPQSKTNGARLKDAISDAYKRAAMRLGVGLHLWAQDEFFLFDRLQSENSPPGVLDPPFPPVENGATGEEPVSSPPSDAAGSNPSPVAPTLLEASSADGGSAT